MKRFSLNLIAMASAILMAGGSALAYPGSQLASHAKITIAQARKMAHKAVPGGRITGEELEKEAGGSGLRYSFDVKLNGKTHEIGIDAQSGKLLENSVEGANSD